MGTIRIELRKETQDKSGLCQVRVVYSKEGTRQYIKTKLKARPEYFAKQQLVYYNKKKWKELYPNTDYGIMPSEKEIQSYNLDLANIRKTISDIEKRFEINGIAYHTGKVIETYNKTLSTSTTRQAPAGEVYTFIDKYLTDHEPSLKLGSLQVYKSLKKHLHAFENKRGLPVDFENMDYNFFVEFQNYLISKTDRPLLNVTIAKQLSTLKTFIGYAKKQAIPISDSYKDFEIKKQKMEVVALTGDEFEAIYNFDLSGRKSLDQVRDVLCFSCVTGLRYSDLSNLEWDNIKKDFIQIRVEKTTEQHKIPLTKIAESILHKYKDHLKPLPVISNAKTNKYLKDLCKLVQINDPVQKVRDRGNKKIINAGPKWRFVSCHTGRKTFATLSLEKGISITDVMATGGWSDYKSFSRYVNVTEKQKQSAMVKAWGEPENRDLKVV